MRTAAGVGLVAGVLIYGSGPWLGAGISAASAFLAALAP